jgi:hypothetical protein
MKTLTGVSIQMDKGCSNGKRYSYANMPPEAPMYLPSVLKTPAVPAPYWKTVTVPLLESALSAQKASCAEALTIDETHDTTDSYVSVSTEHLNMECGTYCHPLMHP